MFECSQSAAKGTNMISKDLAYILGVFLGDGSITSQGYSFCLQAIDKDFVENTYHALNTVTSHTRFVKLNRATSAGKEVWAVYANDVKLCRELKEITSNRTQLPKDFSSWPREIQHSLIAGLLDSEGYVSFARDHRAEDGRRICQITIGIGATDIWVRELHEFLVKNGYEVSNVLLEKLKSGKVNQKFTFNKQSFVKNGLYFTIARKQVRVEEYKKMFPSSTTKRNLPISKVTREKLSQNKIEYWQQIHSLVPGNDIV